MTLPAKLLKTSTHILTLHCHQDAGGQGIDKGIDIGVSQQVNAGESALFVIR